MLHLKDLSHDFQKFSAPVLVNSTALSFNVKSLKLNAGGLHLPQAWSRLDGADPVTGRLPLAGTETLRRSLYWHSHVRTSYGRSDEPASRGAPESAC